MPISSRMAQPEETGDRLDREVFSVENAAHEKPEVRKNTENISGSIDMS